MGQFKDLQIKLDELYPNGHPEPAHDGCAGQPKPTDCDEVHVRFACDVCGRTNILVVTDRTKLLDQALNILVDQITGKIGGIERLAGFLDDIMLDIPDDQELEPILRVHQLLRQAIYR
jgi:hypothetical protein